MKTFSLRTLAVAASALALGTAVAQTTPQSSPPQQTQKGFTGELRSGPWSGETFSRLDANRDGMISREEAQADPTVRDAWSKLDAKNAGRVSRDDFTKYGSTQAQSLSGMR